MKAKHTPGPWEVSQYCENGCGAQLGIKGKDRTLFWNYRIYTGKGCPNETDVEANANAKLIAAAPDLLNACEKIKTLANGLLDYGEVDQAIAGELLLIVNPIIKKATE